jgi:hypothetical protein
MQEFLSMPNLGDFLGSLMGEMAIARFRADAETARIAELYASHDLLKHFAVPRYRLPEVSIDIPVLLPGGEVDTELPGRLKPNQVLPLFETTLEKQLARQNITVPQAAPWRKTLRNRVHRELANVLGPDLQPTAEQIVDKLLSAMEEVPNLSKAVKEALPKIVNGMRPDLIQRILIARASATRIQVLVNTASVREVPDPDRLVRLRLSLREDAMEWTTIETDQGPTQRLVPE